MISMLFGSFLDLWTQLKFLSYCYTWTNKFQQLSASQQYYHRPYQSMITESPQIAARSSLQAYPEYNLSNQLLQHQLQMLQFLYHTEYDIIYETFELKHAAYLERKRGEVVRKFKSEEIARHYQMVSERLHLRILRDDIDLDKVLTKLELLWNSRNTPYFHRYYFLKYLLTTYFKNIQQLITTEQKLISSEQHIHFSIFRAINARESCLRQLRRYLSELRDEDVYEYLHVAKERLYSERRQQEEQKYKIQGYKIKMVVDEAKNGKLAKTKLEFFSDLFNHLTKLTLYVIELITKWKEYIYSLSHDQRRRKERVEYYFYDDNYYLKILTDLGFLKVSFLSNFYDFAPKNDPFMLRCILAFEKREEKTLENELLKHIFMPPADQLSEIMSKLQQLSEEYKHNIRSRRVYNLNVLKKPLQIAQEKSMRNEYVREPVSNIFLKKIQIQNKSQRKFMNKSISKFSPIKNSAKDSPIRTMRLEQSIIKRSTSLNLRGRDRQKAAVKAENEKIIIQFEANRRRKRNTSLPATKQKMVIQQETSPLKNSIIIEKNPVDTANIDKMIDAKLLGLLKEQVIKKVREQFKMQQKSSQPVPLPSLQKNQALQVLIDSKVKQSMKQIFPYQPELNLKPPIEFTTVSFHEEEVSAEIVRIFKKSIFRFGDMQIKEIDLIKKIQTTQFVYFIRANIGEEVIGDFICGLDRDISTYKVLKVFYLGFYDFSQLEMLILRFVQFLWKYQNAFEVVYSFLQPAHNEQITQLLTSLQKTLQPNCICVRKQVYSSIAQVRFIFKRKSKNVNYTPNTQPIGLKITLGALLSDKKVMLENSLVKKKKVQDISYDYFLMEILRKFVTSDDFVLLKEMTRWTDRLKIILQMIISADKEKDRDIKIRLIEAENVTDLNKILSKNNQLLLEVSDLVKTNMIKLLRMDFSLTLPFQVKSVYAQDGTHLQYFRYSINSKVEYWSTGTNNFYMFPTNQLKNTQVLFFQAREYLTSSLPLLTYISHSLSTSTVSTANIGNLWIPMFRYPQKYQQRQDIYIPTFRVQDLFPIKKDLLIGEQVEFFCDMGMQNGVKYERRRGDLVFDRPFGVGVVAGAAKDLLYARIVGF